MNPVHQNQLNEEIKRFKEFIKFGDVITEDFKTQRELYQKQGFSYEDIDKYLTYFRTIKDRNYKSLYDDLCHLGGSRICVVPIERRNDIDSYQRFEDLKTIVDYVRGQVDTGDYEEKLVSSGNLQYEDDIIEIRQAFSDKMCIEYREPFKYSWCISSSNSNSYYSYRNKQRNPTFYFVKIKDRTEKELRAQVERNTDRNPTFTSNNVIDPWHFFVIQVTINGEFWVTSAKNTPGEIVMSWNEILEIDSRLDNYKDLFVSVPSHELDKRYEIGRLVNDRQFCFSPYREKLSYIDGNEILNDVKFKCLPPKLKHHYINRGHYLTTNQINQIENTSSLIERYKTVMNRKIQQNPNDLRYLRGKSISFLENEDLYIDKLIKRTVLLDPDTLLWASNNIKKAYVDNEPSISPDILAMLQKTDPNIYQRYGLKVDERLYKTLTGDLSKWYYSDKNILDELPHYDLQYLSERTLKEAAKYLVSRFSPLPSKETVTSITDFPILIDAYKKKINDIVTQIFSINDVSLHLFDINILTDDSLNILKNKVKRASLSGLKSFKKRLRATNIPVSKEDLKPETLDFFSYVDTEIGMKEMEKKLSSVNVILYNNKYIRDILSVNNDVSLLSSDVMREKFEKGALSLNGENKDVYNKIFNVIPYLQVYYNKEFKNFTNQPKKIVENIISLYKKDDRFFILAKYYAHYFTKQDVQELLNVVEKRVPNYEYRKMEKRLENWYIRGKKKRMGMNESKLTLQEIFMLIYG